MITQAPWIGAIMATEAAAGQTLLVQAVERWQTRLRIAGLIEEPPAGADTCSPGTLVSISDGRRFAIAQDLGCGAEGCTLDSAAVVGAGQWLTEQIGQGCDLVIINKFGKLEAEFGGGMMAPLAAAVELGIPVLLVVPARFREAWAAFAGDLAASLEPQLAAIDAWLARVYPVSQTSGGNGAPSAATICPSVSSTAD